MQPIRRLSAALATIPDDAEPLLTLDDVAGVLPGLSRGALKAVLVRAVRSSLLLRVCHGVYARPRAAVSGLLLFHAAARLRADAFSYLSLESVLGDAGLISQVPLNWVTLMSSGRSHIVGCGRFGRIEFVHTRKGAANVAADLTYDSRARLWRASPALALRDLKAVRRHLDLIDWEAARGFV